MLPPPPISTLFPYTTLFRSNAWKSGDEVPKDLLKYRSSRDEGSCFPNPAGTESIYYDITNYTLLKEIVFLKKLDARVFTNAVNRALVLAGPTRFFQDVARTVKRSEERRVGKEWSS